MIKYHCENCGQLLASRPQSIGKKRRCPACHGYTIVDSLPTGEPLNATTVPTGGHDRHLLHEERLDAPKEAVPLPSQTDFVIVKEDAQPSQSTDFVIVGNGKTRKTAPTHTNRRTEQFVFEDDYDVLSPERPTATWFPEEPLTHHASQHAGYQEPPVPPANVHPVPPLPNEPSPSNTAMVPVGMDNPIPFSRKVQICFEWTFAFLCVLFAITLTLGAIVVPVLIMLGYRPNW